jgi:hypothetical protein
MSRKNLLKSANSKGTLAKACIQYQRTLAHYANENNWAVREEQIIWIGDDDPTYAAQFSLGKRKHDASYYQRNAKNLVREPDGKDSSDVKS